MSTALDGKLPGEVSGLHARPGKQLGDSVLPPAGQLQGTDAGGMAQYLQRTAIELVQGVWSQRPPPPGCPAPGAVHPRRILRGPGTPGHAQSGTDRMTESRPCTPW